MWKQSERGKGVVGFCSFVAFLFHGLWMTGKEVLRPGERVGGRWYSKKGQVDEDSTLALV